MEVDKNKELDDFIRKSVKEVGLERPSEAFTASLLDKIETAAQQHSVTTYKPLISKFGWVMLSIIVLGLSLFALNHKLDIQLAWLEKMNMGAIPKLQLADAIPNMDISNIFLYSLLIFAVFATIQIVFLKQRMDKQYA